MNRTLTAVPQPHRVVQKLTRRVGEQELRRRLWHFLPGCLAILLAGVPRQETVRLWVMLLIIAGGILLPAFLAIRHGRSFRRARCEDLVPSILGYVIPLTVLALLFRSHIQIPIAVASIIAFGDGSATFVGLLTRGPKIPWNSLKSWAGMLAFMLFGTLLAATAFWIASPPAVTFALAIACLAPVAVICAVLETLPVKLNDNITIGVAASLLVVIMQTLLIGW